MSSIEESCHLRKAIVLMTLGCLLIHLNSCYLPKTLTKYDLEFENRKDQVDSYTKNYGFDKRDRLVSYLKPDGQEVRWKSMSYHRKFKMAYVIDDTLYLQKKTDAGPGNISYQAIPISDVQSVRVWRFRTGLTITLCFPGFLLASYILSLLA